MQSIRTFLVYFGVVLVSIGGALLIYLATLVFKIIENPQEVKLMAYLTKFVKGEDKIIHGFAGPQPIEIYFSENMQTMLYSMVGLVMLGVLSRILVSLIMAGSAMIKAGTKADIPKKSPQQQNQSPHF